MSNLTTALSWPSDQRSFLWNLLGKPGLEMGLRKGQIWPGGHCSCCRRLLGHSEYWTVFHIKLERSKLAFHVFLLGLLDLGGRDQGQALAIGLNLIFDKIYKKKQ